MDLWNTLIINPMVNALLFLYGLLFHNLTLTIVVFTIIIRAITFPLTYQSQKSQKKLAEMQERLKEALERTRELFKRAALEGELSSRRHIARGGGHGDRRVAHRSLRSRHRRNARRARCSHQPEEIGTAAPRRADREAALDEAQARVRREEPQIAREGQFGAAAERDLLYGLELSRQFVIGTNPDRAVAFGHETGILHPTIRRCTSKRRKGGDIGMTPEFDRVHGVRSP